MRRRADTNRGLALVIEPERAEASQWRRFHATNDRHLRENLFDRYRRFARALARRHARMGEYSQDLHDDLEQFAYHGLLEAIDRFDPLRGSSFLGFAKARINGSIIDGLGKISEHGARVRFRSKLERERMASLEEERESASATQELAELVTELALGLMLVGSEQAANSKFAGSADNGFDSLAWRETRVLLSQRVDELPEPERTVIRQHYQNDLLFVQIATMLGVSKGRIAQLHRSALGKLRKTMRTIR